MGAGRLFNPPPKITEFTIIGETGNTFECETIAEMDLHVARLTRQIRANDAEQFPDVDRILRSDRDQIQDYRNLRTVSRIKRGV